MVCRLLLSIGCFLGYRTGITLDDFGGSIYLCIFGNFDKLIDEWDNISSIYILLFILIIYF